MKKLLAVGLFVMTAGSFSFTNAEGIVAQNDAYTSIETFDNTSYSTSAKRRWAQTFVLYSTTTIRSISVIAERCIPYENTNGRLWIFKSDGSGFPYTETGGTELEVLTQYSFGADAYFQYGSFAGVSAWRWTDELELGPGTYLFTEAGWNSPTPGDCTGVDEWRFLVNETDGYEAGRATMVWNYSGTALTYTDDDPPFEDADGIDLAFRISTSADDPGVGDGIPWGAYYTPSIYDPDAAAIVASSSLWEAYEATTTLIQLERCVDAGNLFSRALCLSFSYLFMPSPTVLNSWATIPDQAQARFPFSVIPQVQSAFISDASTTTGNMISPEIGFHDLGIGSTSAMGNLLPDVDLLSTTTIMTYVPEPVWDGLQTLMAATFWLGSISHIYASIRQRHAHV